MQDFSHQQQYSVVRDYRILISLDIDQDHYILEIGTIFSKTKVMYLIMAQLFCHQPSRRMGIKDEHTFDLCKCIISLVCLMYIYIITLEVQDQTKNSLWVFGMIHRKDSLLPRGTVWYLDFLKLYIHDMLFLYTCQQFVWRSFRIAAKYYR